MKKIFLLLTAIALIVACNKDNGSDNTSVNLSPEGKQWLVEVLLVPNNAVYLLDLSVGKGKAVFTGSTIGLFKAYSDFYFYSESITALYSCTKDGDSYIIDLGTLFKHSPITFTPYSEDTGIVTWITGTDVKQRQNRLCYTSEKACGKTLTPVDQTSYSWVDMSFGKNHEGIVTNKDGVTNFNKLNNSYECVMLDGGGSAADYEGKDVKGKIVIVTDDESISMSKKREIATEKEAVALIIYHPANAKDEVLIPYKKTYDSVPSGEGLPVGVVYAAEVALRNDITLSSSASFPKG